MSEALALSVADLWREFGMSATEEALRRFEVSRAAGDSAEADHWLSVSFLLTKKAVAALGVAAC